jgi:hypothetical protein
MAPEDHGIQHAGGQGASLHQHRSLRAHLAMGVENGASSTEESCLDWGIKSFCGLVNLRGDSGYAGRQSRPESSVVQARQVPIGHRDRLYRIGNEAVSPKSVDQPWHADRIAVQSCRPADRVLAESD